MKAVLKGGPRDGDVLEVGDAPARGFNLEVPAEDGPWQPLREGEEFPKQDWEMHRYVLSNVDGNPNAPEPRASYIHAGKVPSDWQES